MFILNLMRLSHLLRTIVSDVDSVHLRLKRHSLGLRTVWKEILTFVEGHVRIASAVYR